MICSIYNPAETEIILDSVTDIHILKLVTGISGQLVATENFVYLFLCMQ